MTTAVRLLQCSSLVLLVQLWAWAPVPFAYGAATSPLPGPLGYVSDHGGLLESDWKARIRSVAQDLERKSGVEMVVVTVPNLNRFNSAAEYADALYQGWGVGTTQQNRGIMVLATGDQRQAAVIVGDGLRGTVSLQLQHRMTEQYLQPLFRRGLYGEGLYRLSVALATAAQQAHSEVGGRRMKGLGIFLTAVTGLGALGFLWWISRPDLRHPYRRLRRGEFWGAGQGGFGGNFGGFGGAGSGEGLK